MNKLEKDFSKFRWFFTSSKTLVIGGKSAEQNDQLINKAKTIEKDFIVMHTSSPGSPFSILLKSPEKITHSEINECATFTSCFSRAWREQKKSEITDIFLLSQMQKLVPKKGTWNINGKIKRKKVNLELVLTIQKNYLRAIPKESSIRSFFTIKPCNETKEKSLEKISVALRGRFSKQEILSSLPPGGSKLVTP